jgi:DNA-binding transcriptional ArsR family regulator
MFSRAHGPDVPPRREPPLDYRVVAELLAALSYPARVELLEQLKFPRTVADIRLTPHRQDKVGSPDRASARPTILRHLEKLMEVDLVHAAPAEVDGQRVVRYEVNAQKLYVLAEELRRITVNYAGRGPAGDATGTVQRKPVAPARKGPRLVLVHGVYEGRAYPLSAEAAAAGAWTIGRKRGLPVALDYDPYVSIENSVVEQRGRDFIVRDLVESKNGTTVNWEPMARGGEQVLAPGDVIGVGRSLLSFISA